MNEHFDKEGFELVNFLKTTPDGIALPTPKRIITNVFDKNGDVTHYNDALEILTEEKLISAKLDFLVKKSVNKLEDIAQLLGQIAEAVVVKACNKNREINRHFAFEARMAKSKNELNLKYLDQYVAIGTGLKATNDHPKYWIHYQYSEMQRDVVWVHSNELKYKSLLTIPNQNGAVAGLQIKVSHNYSNVASTLKNYIYPILYFDMNDDWEDMEEYIFKRNKEFANNPNSRWGEVKLLSNNNELVQEIKCALYWYRNLLIGLVNKKISVPYLMEKAKEERLSEFATSLLNLSDSDEILISKYAAHGNQQQDLEPMSVRQHIAQLGRNLYGLNPHKP